MIEGEPVKGRRDDSFHRRNVPGGRTRTMPKYSSDSTVSIMEANYRYCIVFSRICARPSKYMIRQVYFADANTDAQYCLANCNIMAQQAE